MQSDFAYFTRGSFVH
ncbi:hypothetical protein Pint_13724 [Pistacia integerrima]|uniref:Uncharacterized protein n=2 Tax=Pistacia TaxID=55512 RepID=A0ACC1AXL6_9ROSI|nr:hypothetical protein Pint_13724 [Pistacia integerrima]KAJ0091436.1 hypothetical protein Patl1_13819 [Pistacia atlantica]